MNSFYCLSLLEAAAACDPSGVYAPAQELVRAVAAAAPGAEWEGAVRAGDASLLRLLLHPGIETSAVRPVAARLLGVAEKTLAGAAALRRPWLSALWDCRGGAWKELESAVRRGEREAVRPVLPVGGEERLVVRRKFSPECFAAPISGALAEFHSLAPLAEVQTISGREGWSLRLARPLAWPHFLRCTAASAFAPRAAQLSLLLRDAGVVAVDFDGEDLWARFVG